MYAKMQHGPGSGNQSDDEMAFMCYYGLLHCSQDEPLKAMVRMSFFGYWIDEEPEMNPLLISLTRRIISRPRGAVPGPGLRFGPCRAGMRIPWQPCMVYLW